MLVVEGGPNDRDEIPLSKPTTTLGRQAGNDVVVAEPGVSRQHAEIVEAGAGYYLRDLKSTNGTFVNSKRVADDDYLLRDGDSIRLGASTSHYVFRSPSANTLQITLVDEILPEIEGGDATWIGQAVPAPARFSARRVQGRA